jgi:catechol 2,3-dioxygenase-like lactoylglutathione lyase family enzyme
MRLAIRRFGSIKSAFLAFVLLTGCTASTLTPTSVAEARGGEVAAAATVGGSAEGDFLDTHWVETRNPFSATGLAPRPHHLALSVRDLEASRRWYESKLGSREVARFEVGGDLRAVTLTLGVGDFYLELFEVKGSVPEAPASDPVAALKRRGFAHFGFLVGDVRATYRALSARGVEFVVPPTEYAKGMPVAFFRDLDGNLFEISPAHPNPAP